jgi:hypothetical protein
MLRRFLFIIVFFIPLQAGFVTYSLEGCGRFGDRMLCYMHAKWISYKYGLTLLYKPFVYSDMLMMDSLEQHVSNNQHFSRNIEVLSEDIFKHGVDQNALYVVPFFTESSYELNYGLRTYFKVEWADQGFMQILNETVRPKMPLPRKILPSGVVTVAMHMRRGGSFEPFSWASKVETLAVKFPQDIFYKEALDRLYKTLGEQPLYVFIFTDDQRPDLIVEKFVEKFKGRNIVFDCRREKNDHNLNVLEDFFALAQFDCLIRPDSNFSLCASKLKRYMVEVTPGDNSKKSIITVAGVGSTAFTY